MKTFSIATLYGRQEQLQRGVESIYSQVDRINIMLNCYDSVPGFLKDNKIKTYLRNNELGCSEKFYKLGEGWNFTGDDDIIYPPFYAERMIDKAEDYEALVTAYGSIPKKPFLNYYLSRLYFKAQKEDYRITIPGSGVSCWHSSVLKVDYNEIEHGNMSDIYLGIFAKQQNVKVMFTGSVGWEVQRVPKETTIHHNFRNNCNTQTELMLKYFINDNQT